MKFIPLYPYSSGEAFRLGEVEQYKQSWQENKACSEAICHTIRDNYGNNRLGHNIAQGVIDQFGYDRTAFVLANHIQHYDYDGRISRENKAWAKTIFIPKDEKATSFLVEGGVHIGLVDLFVGQYRKACDALNLWNETQVNDVKSLDLKSKVVVLKPTTLGEAHRTPDNQLALVTHGPGCLPDWKRSDTIHITYLVDGTRDAIGRREILGEMKPELLPDWAKAKLQERSNPLANTEMSMEQNYNQIDGIINNVAPKEKPSVKERLQAKPEPSKASTKKPKEVER